MYSSRLITLVFLLFTLTLIAFAQHQGHQMPKPTASPTPAATPSPSGSSTQTHRDSPGMKVPAAYPSPEQMMNTPSPMASPSPSATGHMHGAGTGVDVGSLIVMEGDEMGIRVGSSGTNVISMGAMGSGTPGQLSQSLL